MVVLVAIVAMQPSHFRIVQTAIMTGPAPAVVAQVNDFHNWQAWSPWARRDPAMKHMDTMIGGDFEKGLAAMESVVEKQ